MMNVRLFLLTLRTSCGMAACSPEIGFTSDCISVMMNFLSEPRRFLSSLQLHIYSKAQFTSNVMHILESHTVRRTPSCASFIVYRHKSDINLSSQLSVGQNKLFIQGIKRENLCAIRVTSCFVFRAYRTLSSY